MRIVDSAAEPGRTVSLTFDDGPSPEHTPALLAVLRRYAVPAVFCLVGREVDRHPEVVAAIVADGHVLGNHSRHHDDLSDWSADLVEADLRHTTAAITRAVPGVAVPYFRAPYGHWGRTPTVAARLGMVALGWRLSVADWERPGTDTIVARLHAGIAPGAVVLLHDGLGDRSQTVDAVERVVPAWLAQGWRFGLPERPPTPAA